MHKGTLQRSVKYLQVVTLTLWGRSSNWVDEGTGLGRLFLQYKFGCLKAFEPCNYATHSKF